MLRDARYSAAFLPFVFLCILFLAFSGCEQDNDTDSSADVSGRVLDQSGQPISGALVTYGGQEADALTNENGVWAIHKLAFAVPPSMPVTISKPGFATTRTTVGDYLDGNGEQICLPLDPEVNASFVQVDTPAADSVLLVPSTCQNPTTTVSGYLGQPMDLVILIDASGSMAKRIPGLPLTYMQFVSSTLSQLLSGMDLGRHRVSLMRFYGSTQTLTPLTSSASELTAALPGLLPQDDGTTNFELAIRMASDLLTVSGRPDAEKVILMISDGIPTANGYPETKTDENLLTQELADIQGALSAAEYAAANSAKIHCLAIGNHAAVSKLTTLPAVAAITDGLYFSLMDLSPLLDVFQNALLQNIVSLKVTDDEGNSQDVSFDYDGNFSFSTPVAIDINTLKFTVSAEDAGNTYLFASANHSFEVSTIDGEPDMVECENTGGYCEDYITALHLEYHGALPAKVAVFDGDTGEQIHEQNFTDCDNRLFIKHRPGPFRNGLQFKLDFNFNGEWDEEFFFETDCSDPIHVGGDFGHSMRVLGYTHGEDGSIHEGLRITEHFQFEASKTYDPSAWCDDRTFLEDPYQFRIPEELEVTNGNAGNHWAELHVDDITCVYQGGSSQAHPGQGTSQWQKGLTYNFSYCSNGAQAKDKIKAEHHIRLHISNGDSNHSPTRIQLNLE